MENLIPEFITWLGALIVFMSAMSRFNNPQVLPAETTGPNSSWLAHLRQSFSVTTVPQNLLLRPARANTTVFRYRLYQFFYAFIALLVYFLVLLQPGIREQIQQIIILFVPNDILQNLPKLADAGPLVIASFVILILPNLPPFRWADIKIRSTLYERALIPAQQLREMHRLKMADYHPPAKLLEKVQQISITDGFEASDLVYDNKFPTTQSLWSKCTLLVEQIKVMEADDHYKTAFAVLREADSDKRSVDAVTEIQHNLVADAHVCFREKRLQLNNNSDELNNRESVFREHCRTLLEKIYTLLAGVSLHSHYSDSDRIKQFAKLGFDLKPGPNGPIPDLNDMLILTLIICTVLVLPLSYKLGYIKALMIGAIMFSSVLTPVILAHLCPQLCKRKTDRAMPNVRYPLLSGIIAAFSGFIIYAIGEQFIEPSRFCEFSGFARYTNCSYPWGFLHGGIAILLSLRLLVGHYPDITRLQGWQRYRQWGDFKDASLCALGMIIITAAIVIPELQSIRPDSVEEWNYTGMLIRIGLISFILGFVVPTWYRAQNVTLKKDRRKDNKERDRFNHELTLIRQGISEGISEGINQGER